MVDFHFINDPTTLLVISTILNAAGSNFNAPYDATAQPSDGVSRNNDSLLQFQCPGGSTLQGYCEPSQSESMGSAISSMLSVVAPMISAYGLILPILGVIRGIIEIQCALINPTAVIKAIIRLFTKWIPAFLSLFPPLAGLIIILSIIKTIIAIVLFILTVVYPTIELILFNIDLLKKAFGADGNQQQKDAGREKLTAIIIELLNQIGVLGILKPLLEIIFLILNMQSGFPCSGGDSEGDRPDFTNIDTSSFDGSLSDSSCCTDDVCPPVFHDLPSGRALVVPSFFADGPPLFAWRIVTLTGNSKIGELSPYIQSLKPQLDAQLDEPVDEARSAGQTGDSAHFRIKITGRRGAGQTKTIPLVKLKNKTVIVIDPTMLQLMGVVDYEIIPNWEILIGRNIVGLGCHPDVMNARNAIKNRFPNLEESVIDRFPAVGPIKDLFNGMSDNLDNLLDGLNNEIKDIVSKSPPYDVEAIEKIRNDIVELLTGFVGDMKNRMNLILSDATDTINTGFSVDKNLAKVGGKDKAVISVIPRDVTGTSLLKDLPTDVSINVTLFTDFGTISNQQEDKGTGVVTADIISLLPGEATLTAKINSEFISVFNGLVQRTQEIKVDFVSDAVMPKRRFVSKLRVTSKKRSTVSGNSEREPRN